MKFRPSLIPSLFVLLGLIILVNLGAWQVRRMGETERYLARIHERFDKEPLHNEVLTKTPEEISFSPVAITGAFRDGPVFVMTGRGEFGEIGYDIVQPFDAVGGELLLVNRGWVPRDRYETLVKENPPPAGETVISGLILNIAEYGFSPEVPAIAADASGPERWPRDHYAAMAKHAALNAKLVVVEGKALEDGQAKSADKFPVTGFVANPPTRPHLEYAMTWFLIGATLIVIWVGGSLKREA